MRVGCRNKIPKAANNQNICTDCTEKMPKEISSLWRDFKRKVAKVHHLALKKHLENQLWRVLAPFKQFLNGNIDYSKCY